MKKIVIVYETGEGHTQTVAERVASTLKADGCGVQVVLCKAATPSMLTDSDGIILGGSIHLGRHSKQLMRFAEQHRDLLSAKPNAFFLLCLTAKFETPEKKAEAARYLEDFAKRTGFAPGHAEAFAGALLFTKYNFIKRAMMKSIAEKEGETDVDTSRDYVFTDWDAVDTFARAFLARLD